MKSSKSLVRLRAALTLIRCAATLIFWSSLRQRPSAGLAGYFTLKAELEALLGRSVDLVEPRSVRNPYVLAGINSARELVYAA